jgi:hypothetical protein
VFRLPGDRSDVKLRPDGDYDGSVRFALVRVE